MSTTKQFYLLLKMWKHFIHLQIQKYAHFLLNIIIVGLPYDSKSF